MCSGVVLCWSLLTAEVNEGGVRSQEHIVHIGNPKHKVGGRARASCPEEYLSKGKASVKVHACWLHPNDGREGSQKWTGCLRAFYCWYNGPSRNGFVWACARITANHMGTQTHSVGMVCACPFISFVSSHTPSPCFYRSARLADCLAAFQPWNVGPTVVRVHGYRRTIDREISGLVGRNMIFGFGYDTCQPPALLWLAGRQHSLSKSDVGEYLHTMYIYRHCSRTRLVWAVLGL